MSAIDHYSPFCFCMLDFSSGVLLEIPHFFGHENRKALVSKGWDGDFRAVRSGNAAWGFLRSLPNVRVISPQPFAPRGKGRFARVRAARQSPDWLRVRRLSGAKSRAVGAGAFGLSGGVRACRRVTRPA